MTALSRPKDKTTVLDPAKLQNLQEPLLLRVVKLKGSTQMPIELPSKEGNAPGAGWTRDEVLSLETWLLTKWTGGGHYRCTVIDARGQDLTWEFLFDPRIYPEKVPPNTAEAAIVSNQPTGPGPQQTPNNVTPLGQSPSANWPPTGNQFGYGTPPQSGVTLLPSQQSQGPQPVQQQAQPSMPWNQSNQQTPWNPAPSPWGMQPYGYPPTYMFQGPQSSYTRTRDELRERSRGEDDFSSLSKQRQREKEQEEVHNARERELENKLRQAELHQKEMEYKSQLDRIQQEQARQIQAMQTQQSEQIRALQEELRRGAESRKGEDPEIVKLREEAQRQRELAQAEQARLQREAEAQKAALQQQLMEAQFQQLRAAADQQIAMLRDQLASMATQAAQPKGESEEIRALRTEQERLRYEADRERERERIERENEKRETERRIEAERAERQREREAFERERRDEQLQRQIAEQREAFERQLQVMNEKHNRGPDPMIEAFKENARQSAEQMKELARMQQNQTDRMAGFMMNPLQISQMVKESSSGNDSLMRNMVQSVEGIVSMYRGAAEQVMQMSGGGGDSPTVRLLQEGMNGVKDTAERYITMKRDQVVSEARVKQAEAQAVAQRTAAEAHIQATAIQAQAQVAQAQAQPQWSPPPPVVQNGNGLSGVDVIPTPTPRGKKPKAPVGDIPEQENPQPARVEGVPNTVTPAQVANEQANLKMFGPAWESIQKLRLGVSNGLTPSEAVDAILQGVQVVVENNLQIPAFKLFDDERFADLIDILFPQVEQAFKDECVRILHDEVDMEEPQVSGDPE